MIQENKNFQNIEEKHKPIINSILDAEKALDYFRTAFSTYRKILKKYIENIDNYNNMSNYERAQKIIEQIPRDEENKELLDMHGMLLLLMMR